jgi:hypothetical protein
MWLCAKRWRCISVAGTMDGVEEEEEEQEDDEDGLTRTYHR